MMFKLALVALALAAAVTAAPATPPPGYTGSTIWFPGPLPGREAEADANPFWAPGPGREAEADANPIWAPGPGREAEADANPATPPPGYTGSTIWFPGPLPGREAEADADAWNGSTIWFPGPPEAYQKQNPAEAIHPPIKRLNNVNCKRPGYWAWAQERKGETICCKGTRADFSCIAEGGKMNGICVAGKRCVRGKKYPINQSV